MSLKRIALTITLLIAFAFVPALPIVHLGETSWSPVWTVYPYFIGYLSDAGFYHREAFFFLVVIAAHFGLSIGLAAALDIFCFRSKRSYDEDEA
jgi:hypothetical protein